MIKPTIGRVVWFWPSPECHSQLSLAYSDKTMPLSARVAYVWSDRMVNLAFEDQNGRPFNITSVLLMQGDEEYQPVGSYCEWMPFQKGQAAKQETASQPTPATQDKSPRTGDDAIEQQIQAKGLTAPRVTPDDIKANIAMEFYFTGADGVIGAAALKGPSSTEHHILATVEHNPAIAPGLGLLTFCVLILRNGTKVVGINYGAIDPDQHDPEKGRTEARNNAIEQVWPLLGYQLREQLYQAQQPAQAPVESAIPPHQQRVITEKAELDEKREKLNAFMEGEQFHVVCDEVERMRMIDQYNAMTRYSEALGERIDAFTAKVCTGKQ